MTPFGSLQDCHRLAAIASLFFGLLYRFVILQGPAATQQQPTRTHQQPTRTHQLNNSKPQVTSINHTNQQLLLPYFIGISLLFSSLVQINCLHLFSNGYTGSKKLTQPRKGHTMKPLVLLSTCYVRETQTRHKALYVFLPFRRRAVFFYEWSRFDATIKPLNSTYSTL